MRSSRSEVRGPRFEVRGSRSEVRGPRCEVRGPRCEVRGPRCEVRGTRCEVRGPRYEVRGARLYGADASIAKFDLKWMVYNGNPTKINDLGVPLFLETPIFVLSDQGLA